MIRKEDVYRIGKIGKPHGVAGEVSFLFDDDVFDRTDTDYLILDIDGILVPFFIEEYRFKGSETSIMKFCDIDTQEKAAELTGCDVYFPRHIADQDDDNMSWAEIIGFALVDETTGDKVGTITHVDDATINVLFSVETPEGDEILIPASEDLITDVDKPGRTITMRVPEGLLDL